MEFPSRKDECNTIEKNLNSETVAILVFDACENHGADEAF